MKEETMQIEGFFTKLEKLSDDQFPKFMNNNFVSLGVTEGIFFHCEEIGINNIGFCVEFDNNDIKEYLNLDTSEFDPDPNKQIQDDFLDGIYPNGYEEQLEEYCKEFICDEYDKHEEEIIEFFMKEQRDKIIEELRDKFEEAIYMSISAQLNLLPDEYQESEEETKKLAEEELNRLEKELDKALDMGLDMKEPEMEEKSIKRKI
ncbi:MAG: hypothetical protein ACTTIR_07605 [Eggerthia catenaformis]|uniref:hypothetical protein n=1 Tax=Eggerthia catenaformis TaxID=31973 RepID=UPI003F9FC28A